MKETAFHLGKTAAIKDWFAERYSWTHPTMGHLPTELIGAVRYNNIRDNPSANVSPKLLADTETLALTRKLHNVEILGDSSELNEIRALRNQFLRVAINRDKARKLFGFIGLPLLIGGLAVVPELLLSRPRERKAKRLP